MSRLGWIIRQGRARGIRSSIRHGLRLLNLNPTGYYYYLQMKRNAARVEGTCQPNPFEILWVSPEQIQDVSTASFHKWLDAGSVYSGDWDKKRRPFEETRVFRSLRARYRDKLSWDETPIYSWSVKRISEGNHGWQMCTSQSELNSRCAEVDQLFDEIVSECYKSWEEMTGQTVRQTLRSRNFGPHMTDVAVHIDRDGEFLFVDGRHRLSIAKLLNIDQIAVRVVVRHTRWHKQRASVVSEHDSVTDVVASDEINHPDLRSVID